MDAAFVVDATGRRSSYARAHGARQVVFDQLVAVVMFVRFDAPGALPDSYTSIEPCEHGWWYAASLPKGTMAAILMTDAALLRRLPWRTREQWSSLLAAAPYTASTFDPLSSQGIVKALRSAITASLAICQHLAGQSGALATFNARLGREYDHYLNQRATYYAGEQRWPDAPFWRCRHQSTVTRPGRNADAVHVENQHQEEPEAARAGGV
jgi:hypothetical protein